MTGCCLDLAKKIASRCDENVKEHNWDLQGLNAPHSDDSFYFKEADSNQLKERPWRMDPNYFKKVYISSIALIKIALHARSGGSIEIMGMMTGKIINNSIVVMDVYHLPVEGTETRVNAQAEGYEYMVQYLESLKQINRNENIVGWYHSHPGYGCWLSGIDVATQALNQNFQDPYLAIVIDPIKTAKQNKVEIGAFRTYPDNYKSPASNTGDKEQQKKLPHSKRNDFGIHSEKYYSLDVEIFKSSLDEKILNLMQNKSWVSNIIQTNSMKEINNTNINIKILNLLDSFKINDSSKLSRVERHFANIFDFQFESTIMQKLLDSDGEEFSGNSSSGDGSRLNDDYSDGKKGSETGEDEDDADESDLEDTRSKAATLDFSDVDDAVSMDSGAALRNDEETLSCANAEYVFEGRSELSSEVIRRDVYKKRGPSRLLYSKKTANLNRPQVEEVKLPGNINSLTKGEQKDLLATGNKSVLRRYGKFNNSMSTSNDMAMNVGTTVFQDFLVLDTQERLFLGL